MQLPMAQYIATRNVTQAKLAAEVGKHARQVVRWINEGAMVEYDGRTMKPLKITKSKSWIVWTAGETK